MRVRPDGVELLRAARAVVDATLAPHVAAERGETVHAIRDALALAEDRLAHDAEPAATELAALDAARAAIHGELLDALPEPHRYDARLVAKALAVATRQLENGPAPERRAYERLANLLGVSTRTDARPADVRCSLPALDARLCSRIRAGDADPGSASHAATLAHLVASTRDALAESSPNYLRRRTAPTPPVASHPLFPSAAGEAMYALSKAALARPSHAFGWFAQRLAANPRVPMFAIEAAHQAHDLSISIAETNIALLRLTFAPFRLAKSHVAESGSSPR